MTLLAIAAHLRDLANEIEAEIPPPVIVDNTHWLEYPLDQAAPVSAEFGEPLDIGGKRWTHEGIDWPIKTGCPVRACASGLVVWAEYRDGYGMCVRVQHDMPGETWHTIYGHLSKITVAVNQVVQGLQIVGLSGNTGNTTGPHLHLTVQRSSDTTLLPGLSAVLRGCVNPRLYLKWPK